MDISLQFGSRSYSILASHGVVSSVDAHHVAIAVADTSRNQQLDVADSFGHRLETEGSLVRAIALLVQASYLSAQGGAKAEGCDSEVACCQRK